MQRSLSISSGGRPKGERRQIRKDSILNRQAGRQGRQTIESPIHLNQLPMAHVLKVEW